MAVAKKVHHLNERQLEQISEGRARIYGLYNGDRVLELRRKLGLSVSDFANWLGVCNSTIYAWEGGKKVVRPQRMPSHLAQRAIYQLERFFFPGKGDKEIF